MRKLCALFIVVLILAVALPATSQEQELPHRGALVSGISIPEGADLDRFPALDTGGKPLAPEQVSDLGLTEHKLVGPWIGLNWDQKAKEFQYEVLMSGTSVLVDSDGIVRYKLDCGNRLVNLPIHIVERLISEGVVTPPPAISSPQERIPFTNPEAMLVVQGGGSWPWWLEPLLQLLILLAVLGILFLLWKRRGKKKDGKRNGSGSSQAVVSGGEDCDDCEEVQLRFFRGQGRAEAVVGGRRVGLDGNSLGITPREDRVIIHQPGQNDVDVQRNRVGWPEPDLDDEGGSNGGQRVYRPIGEPVFSGKPKPEMPRSGWEEQRGESENDPFVPGLSPNPPASAVPFSDKDELYGRAVELVKEAGEGSISHLQRELGIGYARAGRLVDMMEEEGILGPPEGSNPRRLLVKPDDSDDWGGGSGESWPTPQSEDPPAPPPSSKAGEQAVSAAEDDKSDLPPAVLPKLPEEQETEPEKLTIPDPGEDREENGGYPAKPKGKKSA